MTLPPSHLQIREIIRKDKVMEIFRGVESSPGTSLFENQNIDHFIHHKFKTKVKTIKYM